MSRTRGLLACLATVWLFGTACGARESNSVVTSTTATVSMADFIAAADAVCMATWPKMAALSDPDGDGGQKQPGLGTVVREYAEELASIAAPDDIADQWAQATELLRQSGIKLEESELLEATGDPGAEDAQNEALWVLQPRASEIILSLEVPFQACSFS